MRGHRPPPGAVESPQARLSETTNATPRAAIERRLDVDDMAGLGTFSQRTRVDSQRSLISLSRTTPLPAASAPARSSPDASEALATGACAPVREGQRAAARALPPRRAPRAPVRSPPPRAPAELRAPPSGAPRPAPAGPGGGAPGPCRASHAGRRDRKSVV